ncbi:MAG: GNAT family N-acetyltransferase [Clostridia bacterium]|nr:GNAT family N-acetyltransferase [Clostridia bacterium]
MSTFAIRPATDEDYGTLSQYEHHIEPSTLRKCISDGYMLIAESDDVCIGWLRWNRFWDIVPFMNHLFVLEEYRGKGCGRLLTEYWEREMQAAGCDVVMTSSAQDECAQHFYVKLGYSAIGGFMLKDDPLEILFQKWFQ